MDKLGEEGIFACSGEMSDFQNLQKTLNEKFEEDFIENDGVCFLHTKDYHNYVARMQYNKRLKNDPMQITVVMAGIDRSKNNEVFLGTSNSHGMKIEENWVATGIGNYFCQVLLTNKWRPDMTEQEARSLIEECMRVLFFRDKKAHDLIQISTVTHQAGVNIGVPYRIEASTDF